jgi:hypothetical protein
MSSQPIIDPDSLPLWHITRAGSDYEACPACGEEVASWQLLFAKADDPEPPVWLCLSCLQADIRASAAYRVRRSRRKPPVRRLGEP